MDNPYQRDIDKLERDYAALAEEHATMKLKADHWHATATSAQEEVHRVGAERAALAAELEREKGTAAKLSDRLGNAEASLAQRRGIEKANAQLAAELERLRAELAFEKAQTAKTVRALNLDIADKEAGRVGLLKLMEDVAFELEASSFKTTNNDRVEIVAAQAKRLRETIHAALGPAGEGVPVEMVNRAIPQQTLAVLALIAKKEAELDELRAMVEERQATRDDAPPPELAGCRSLR